MDHYTVYGVAQGLLMSINQAGLKVNMKGNCLMIET